MMLTLLSSLGFLCSVLVGLIAPKRAGWFVLALVPVLGPTSFTLVPSSALPLTTYRVAFGVTLGVALAAYAAGVRVTRMFRDPGIAVVVVFLGIVSLISVGDRMVNVVFTDLPRYFFALVLCMLLIRDKRDLGLLARILVWQGATIGGLVLLEFYGGVNVGMLLRSTVPNLDVAETVSSATLSRSGFQRASGIDGNAVLTGYRLAMLLPLTLWYASKGKPWRLLPLAAAMSALVLVQTRAAWLAVVAALVVLAVQLITLRADVAGRALRVGRVLVAGSVALAIIVIIAPQVLTVATAFVSETLIPMVTLDEAAGVENKLSRIPIAIEYIRQRPFTGYGSPDYAYYVVMNTADIPGPVLYALSGGVALGVFYVFLVFFLPARLFLRARRSDLTPDEQEFLTYAATGLLAGMIATFSNFPNNHFLVGYLLYVAIAKIYLVPVPRRRVARMRARTAVRSGPNMSAKLETG